MILNAPGYAVGAALMLLFTLINLWGVSRLSRANTTIVWWKIAVPVLTVVVLVGTQFSSANFSAGNGFALAGVNGILSAIATGGVVFAYLGFEQAIQFGGETRDPKRNIPFAMVGAMLIGAVFYILLEVAFAGALNPHAAAHGWANLTFTNTFGPFAALATVLGLGWFAVVLYIGAVVSPGGTGLIYTGSSARVSYALSRNGYIPRAFVKISDRGVPWIGIIFAFAVGMVVFLPSRAGRSWSGSSPSVSVLIIYFSALRCRLPAAAVEERMQNSADELE